MHLVIDIKYKRDLTGVWRDIRQLRVPPTLQEDTSLAPSTSIGCLRVICNFRGSDNLFWPLWAHAHTQTLYVCVCVKLNLKRKCIGSDWDHEWMCLVDTGMSCQRPTPQTYRNGKVWLLQWGLEGQKSLSWFWVRLLSVCRENSFPPPDIHGLKSAPLQRVHCCRILF